MGDQDEPGLLISFLETTGYRQFLDPCVQTTNGGDWEIKKFSPQVWEPFARWVSKAHPKDAAVMYPDASHTGVELSEASIRLWKRNTQRYVAHVTRSD